MLQEMNVAALKEGESPLKESEIKEYQSQVPEWQVVEQGGEKQIQRVFSFKNFSQALAFTDLVGRLAEEQDHHPAILTEWGRATVTWWTHKIRGLHHNDFIMAAKTDAIYRNTQH